MGRTACTEPQCLYKGVLYLYLWSWKSRAIPLLPLWAVRPVQSLSACTRMHITFTFGHERVELYLYSLYGPYGLYRASVPVQGCTLPFFLTITQSYPNTDVDYKDLQRFLLKMMFSGKRNLHRFQLKWIVLGNRNISPLRVRGLDYSSGSEFKLP